MVRNTLVVLLVLTNIAFFSGIQSTVGGDVIDEAIKICGLEGKSVGELYPAKVRFFNTTDWESVRCTGDIKRKSFIKAKEKI